MLCPWPKRVNPEVCGRWLPQCVIKQQTASLNMDAALLSASLLWHLCPTPDSLPSPIFHGTLHAVKEVNKQSTGGKRAAACHQPQGLRVMSFGKHKEKFVSPEVTHLRVPHYTVYPTTLRCHLPDSSKEYTLKMSFMYSLGKMSWNVRDNSIERGRSLSSFTL